MLSFSKSNKSSENMNTNNITSELIFYVLINRYMTHQIPRFLQVDNYVPLCILC